MCAQADSYVYVSICAGRWSVSLIGILGDIDTSEDFVKRNILLEIGRNIRLYIVMALNHNMMTRMEGRTNCINDDDDDDDDDDTDDKLWLVEAKLLLCKD